MSGILEMVWFVVVFVLAVIGVLALSAAARYWWFRRQRSARASRAPIARDESGSVVHGMLWALAIEVVVVSAVYVACVAIESWWWSR